jgi:hypothetical protein
VKSHLKFNVTGILADDRVVIRAERRMRLPREEPSRGQLSLPYGTDIRRRLDSMDWTAPKGSLLSIDAVAPLEHTNCFNHDSLVSLAASQGLKPIRSLACGPRATRQQQVLNTIRRLRDAVTGRWQRSTFLFFQAPGEWTPAS